MTRTPDPHLRERAYFQTLEHPEAGTHEYPGVLWRAKRTPNELRHAAPRLGEDNEYVYKELLGYSEEGVPPLPGDGPRRHGLRPLDPVAGRGIQTQPGPWIPIGMAGWIRARRRLRSAAPVLAVITFGKHNTPYCISAYDDGVLAGEALRRLRA